MALPSFASLNIAATLDVIQIMVFVKPIKILAMSDFDNITIRLQQLQDISARTAFRASFTRWILICDSHVFTIVGGGRNLTNKYMASK